MKKIFLTLNYIKDGGLERVLVDIVKALYGFYDITIILIYDIVNEDYYKEICDKVEIVTLDKYRKKIKNRLLLSVYSRLYDRFYFQKYLYKRFLRTITSDIEIAFSESPSLRLVSCSKNRNKIAWIHTDFLEDPYFRDKKDERQYKKLFSKFKSIVFVSSSLEEKFKKYYRLSNTCTIHNSIDLNRIKYLTENDLAIQQCDNRKIEFIAIGRLSFEKGFERLVESFSKLSSDEKNKSHLTIVGDGSEFYNLKSQIQKLELGEVITLMGTVHNPYNLLKNSDVLLSPSRYEGFGLVILEAFALEIPVVATKTVGAVEILDSGKFGILLENIDNAFDNIVSAIIKDRNVVDKFKPLLRGRAQMYSFSAFKQKILNLLLS